MTARAYTVRLLPQAEMREANQAISGDPLVCRVFQDDFGTGDQTLVEHALHEALTEHGFGAPRVLASGDEKCALSAPYMLMERVEGQNVFGPLVLALTLASVTLLFGYPLPLLLVVGAYWLVMTRLLTRLHAVPGEAVMASLESRGLERDRLSVGEAIRGFQLRVKTEELAPLIPLVAWLAEHEPAAAETPVVCHGDFWFGNLMISPRRAQVTLLDWTQARIGHPELDLGWMGIQHISRLPLDRPINETLYALMSEAMRPWAWVLMGANVLMYRLVRRVDRERLRYFTVFAATRVLIDVTAERASFEASGASVPPAILAAWGSGRSVSLLLKKVAQLTGLRISLRTPPE